MKFVSLILLILLGLAPHALAQLGFQELVKDQVHVEKLSITKESFFAFLQQDLNAKPLGLGPGSQVNFDLCHYPAQGKPLASQRNELGKEIKFLSNPSCQQIVLKKILISSYGYKPNSLSSYRDRQCTLGLIKMFKPILAYYVIQIEEPAKAACPYCDSMAQYQAQQIFKEQGKVNTLCGVEAGKTARFIGDLSNEVERILKEKVSKKP